MSLETIHIMAAIEAIDEQLEALVTARDFHQEHRDLLSIEISKIDRKLVTLTETKDHLCAMTVDTWEETATEGTERPATTDEPDTSPFIPTPPPVVPTPLPIAENWQPGKRRKSGVPVNARCGNCDAFGHVNGVKCADCNGTGRAPWSN